MINEYALSARARRILIAILAFALAAGFAFAASIAPAEAAKDRKEYTAEVGPLPDNEDTVPAGPGSMTTITFRNVSPTSTQLAGSFRVVFPAAFTVTGATITSTSAGSWTESVSNNTVVVSADSGGDRIPVEGTVIVDVFFDAPASGTFELATAGDQQAGGVFKPGGNQFKLVSAEPTLIIESAFIPCGTSCIIEDPEDDWTAEVSECTAGCSYLLTDDDTFVADITILTTGGFVIVLETETKGPNPGDAFVDKFTNAGVFVERLPFCGSNGTEPSTNCVHIHRIRGNHTQYTVFLTEDPRIKFG